MPVAASSDQPGDGAVFGVAVEEVMRHTWQVLCQSKIGRFGGRDALSDAICLSNTSKLRDHNNS
jgi:hypothetical protein